MRNLLIGIGLALVFLGGLFLASRLLPHGAGALAVSPGYVGSRQFDGWLLFCAPASARATDQQTRTPIPLQLTPRAAPMGTPLELSRCRATVVFARGDAPSRAIAVSFRMIGAKQRLAMIVRFPPLAKRGDPLVFRLGAQQMIFPVANCPGGGCVAMMLVDQQLEGRMVAGDRGLLVFPAGVDGRRLVLVVPFRGLGDALTNLRVAQS